MIKLYDNYQQMNNVGKGFSLDTVMLMKPTSGYIVISKQTTTKHLSPFVDATIELEDPNKPLLKFEYTSKPIEHEIIPLYG